MLAKDIPTWWSLHKSIIHAHPSCKFSFVGHHRNFSFVSVEEYTVGILNIASIDCIVGSVVTNEDSEEGWLSRGHTNRLEAITLRTEYLLDKLVLLSFSYDFNISEGFLFYPIWL